MNVMKNARWALALVLPLVASAGHASSYSNTNGAYSYTASGVADLSWPLFLDTNETIKVERKGSSSNYYWQLTGTGSTASFWGGLSNSVNLGSESVKYQANFNSSGKLITSMGSKTLSNYLEIKGSLPAGTFGGTSWTNQPYQTLLKADLLDVKPGNGTPDLIGNYAGVALGFNTKFTGGWVANNTGLTGGSTGESLWLAGLSTGFQNLVKALDGYSGNGTLSSLIGSSKTITGVVSVASVPVPGAIWLFGTGLMTLVASRRKNTGSSRLAV
ncbi:MAG: PEP-CTERM sorting domain-containing protein [Methylococcaceae bacterium]|nr:PEP-CTERM sorting domain-containing protein [Methylococcaceae bacterium]